MKPENESQNKWNLEESAKWVFWGEEWGRICMRRTHADSSFKVLLAEKRAFCHIPFVCKMNCSREPLGFTDTHTHTHTHKMGEISVRPMDCSNVNFLFVIMLCCGQARYYNLGKFGEWCPGLLCTIFGNLR